MMHYVQKSASFITNTARAIAFRFDPELLRMRKIIQESQRMPSSTSYDAIKNDQIFIRRLQAYPTALKMRFWEDHFELKSLSAYPEISGRILDFGCGSGHLDILLARKGNTIHGIDMSTIGINIANHLRSKENKSVQNRVSFAAIDVTSDFPNGELFDSAWSAHVFEHIADPRSIFLGLRNWLKPGAHILISVPLGNAYNDPDHVNHFFNDGELRSYLSSHIKVIKIDTSQEYEVMRALCRFD